ncbi:MAG TPA: class I SAM-dependent methyltransferase [Roseiflexaceae bacterium]|nr:class I SAM-dependent methyltransferase [Roseiflexaceae bacterium]
MMGSLRDTAPEVVQSAFRFACPSCRAPLEDAGPALLRCPTDALSFGCVDGIWRFLPPEHAAGFGQFLHDYSAIRAAEGYGYDDGARYLRLPQVDSADPLAWQWRMRATSFACLRRNVLASKDNIHEVVPEASKLYLAAQSLGRRTMDDGRYASTSRLSSIVYRLLERAGRFSCLSAHVHSQRTSLQVLDLGAGVGWLSNRLDELGHHPCAVDLNLDPRDGLGAARHYGGDWPRVQAEFDRLPLADRQADIVIYNASLHYSTSYRATLAEALRLLRPGGRIIVMDSPIYRHEASGRQMIAERQAAFVRDHGTRSDALPSIGYLTWDMLCELGRELGLGWRIIRPWYGWRWALRPWRARLARKREPSTFALLVAEREE